MPLFLTGMARGLMGRSHCLQMRHRRKDALKAADVVVLAGMPCDFRLNYGRSINSGAKLIAVNRSRADLYLNRRPYLAIQADPFQTLCALGKAADGNSGRWAEWLEVLRQSDLAREREITDMAAAPVKGVNPMAFLGELEQFLEEGSILVADGGDFVGTAAYILRPRGPLSWLDPGVFGTLGVGAGFAAGARLSQKNSRVWLLYGDGAAGYSLPEFDTFVRHGLPVIAVVGNDAGWSQIARDQVKYLKDDVATALAPTAYEQVVEGFGAKGLRVAQPDEIRPALEEARRTAAAGRPVLINVLIGRTDFRDGSISM
jgi:acetolactate synthase-1/2/3 large subunit